MAEPRVPLYDRLPELYRLRDAEQSPPYQLRSYLSLVERALSAIHENIESLYHDLFIETCDPWVIPYIGDLLGTSHLAGDPWTLRADVADTIALRRRKGTLGAIELSAFDLTAWGVHAVELRKNLVWSQHLNHQRPDAGGKPAFAQLTRHTVIRGGTATLRDPATLSLLDTPFDDYAHLPDFRSPSWGALRYNLPNLAIFLWRLHAYTVRFARPAWISVQPTGLAAPAAPFVVRFCVHPLGERVTLFNTFRWDPDERPPVVTHLDAVPGPMPPARLTTGAPSGNPDAYVFVESYDGSGATVDPSKVGLRLHLPEPDFLPLTPPPWLFRGADLCAWEPGLRTPLVEHEVAIDPVLGRLAIGVGSLAQANALAAGLRVTYTYGAVGPVGAHPISRAPAPTRWNDEVVPAPVQVDSRPTSPTLEDALKDLHLDGPPLVVEVADSGTYDFDPSLVAGALVEDGGPNLRVGRSLILRAVDGHRPILRLDAPLRFRPTEVTAATPADQPALDARVARLTVRLEGLYLTRGAGLSAGDPLLARAALHALELHDCTLDPGGGERIDHTRAPTIVGAILRTPYGFADATDQSHFRTPPSLRVRRSITGPLFVDTGYHLELTESIVDGAGDFALSGASLPPATGWGPETRVDGVTIFGRMRVERLSGRGGIFTRQLEVLDNQHGCVKYSYFSGDGDRLPQNHACVRGPDALLRFTSETFGAPAYGQLAHPSDFHLRERGPRDDAMGAFGFLFEAHKWRNLQIRFRELMPVGVRPLLIPVT
jgi:hypothetical protein